VSRSNGRRQPRAEARGSVPATASLLLATAVCAVTLVACVGVQVAPEATIPASKSIRRVAPEQAQRLYDVMVPLLRAMDDPLTPSEVHVALIDEPAINAANAGGGNFYVTTALMAKASTKQLRGIMAHEIAHEDLGHVAQMQLLGAGLNVGAYLLEQLAPGSSAISSIAGSLIARGYSREEEYAADSHAVEILRRAGYSRESLIEALTWIAGASGGGGGGFLSTHPATDERIAALRS